MSIPKFQPNDHVRHIGSFEILTVKIWYEAVNKYSVWKGDDAGTQTILAEDELELVERASSGFDDDGPRLIPTQSIMN